MIKSFKDLEVYIEAYDLAIDELIKRYLFLGGKLTNLRNNWKTF